MMKKARVPYTKTPVILYIYQNNNFQKIVGYSFLTMYGMCYLSINLCSFKLSARMRPKVRIFTKT